MKDIPIDQIKPGTLLGASLTNDQGSLILNRGTELTESILKRLRRIGVEALPISSSPDMISTERYELRKAIEERFKGKEGNPFLHELKQLALEHLER